MKYPSWKDFESKYPDYQEIAFEALARMLFRCRYELGDSLPYFKNHAGNETETIVVDGEEIGFQAKYFDNEINASLIEHSIKTAHNNHPSQSKMIVYTNLEFGNPRKRGETKTEKQKNIEQVAKDCNIQLEWIASLHVLKSLSLGFLPNRRFCCNSRSLETRPSFLHLTSVFCRKLRNRLKICHFP